MTHLSEAIDMSEDSYAILYDKDDGSAYTHYFHTSQQAETDFDTNACEGGDACYLEPGTYKQRLFEVFAGEIYLVDSCLLDTYDDEGELVLSAKERDPNYNHHVAPGESIWDVPVEYP